MKVLAWDTSSISGVVGAFISTPTGPKVVAEWTLSLETSRHSERLLWSIDQVLKSAGWSIQEVNAIVVGVGPGSFTGVRIGVTTARILASQLNIPIVPVSSLVVLARPLAEWIMHGAQFSGKSAGAKKLNEKNKLIVAATDAAKGEWFTLMGSPKDILNCVGTSLEKSLWAKGVKELCVSSDAVMVHIEKSKKTPYWIGSGFERNLDFVKHLRKKYPPQKKYSLTTISSSALSSVTARSLIQVGWEGLQQDFTVPFTDVTPHYMRGSEAEEKLKKGLLKVAPTSASFGKIQRLDNSR